MDYQHGTTWPMNNGQREIDTCHDCGRPVNEPCEPVSNTPATWARRATRPVAAT